MIGFRLTLETYADAVRSGWPASDLERANLYAPAAFIRHGALPDPRDLDARGGERHAWAP